jgi:hypothetical protein
VSFPPVPEIDAASVADSLVLRMIWFPAE